VAAPRDEAPGERSRWTERDVSCQRLAIELAARGRELVSPNPVVGAVLVRRGRVIGKGYHGAFGGPHAEVEALRDAVRKGHNPAGADLYVTLEPCGHQGKTPPCSEAVIAAKVRRVYFGARDMHPITRGLGLRHLRRSGIDVRGGLLGAECEAQNRPYFHWLETGLPWTIIKWSMTLDGRTATASGESRWITGSLARAHAHSLRRRVDAIVVGTETALRDDPLLTPRPSRGRRPLRVILDRRGRLPLDLKLLAPQADRGTEAGARLYVASPRVSARRLRTLESRGLSVLLVPERGDRLDLRFLFRRLGKMQVSQLLVDGGAHLVGSVLAQGLAQEVAAYIAPRLLGGEDARPAIEGWHPARLIDTPWIAAPQVVHLGGDLLLQGEVAKAPRR
jgi:diaminohydroxyphosphoribosylaminopyrimidine deaminase/5-amino-6-(5-phosphoribosylamino)uracil reductase